MDIARNSAAIMSTSASARARLFRRAATAALLTAASLLPAAVYAQADVQNQSVYDRPRPEYDTEGIRLGSFRLQPSVESDVSFDDNVFAQPDGQSDVIFRLLPRVVARLERPLYDVRLDLLAEVERYLENGSENTEDLAAQATARYGLGTRTLIAANAAYRIQSEDRRSFDSVSDSGTRLTRHDMSAELGARQDLGNLDITANGRMRRVTYGDARDATGDPTDFSFRDFTLYQLSGGAAYGISANDEVSARLTYDRRDYAIQLDDPDFDPTRFDRTSEGWRAEVGYGRQVSELLFLRVLAGYLQQNYQDPRLQNISGLSLDGDMLWNFSPLTSVRATISRAIDETVSPLRAGNLRTQASARVDHELLRNLVLSGYVRGADIDPSGIGDQIQEYEVSASARYLFSRRLSFRAALEHFTRSSDNADIAFSENIATLGVRYAL